MAKVVQMLATNKSVIILMDEDLLLLTTVLSAKRLEMTSDGIVIALAQCLVADSQS